MTTPELERRLLELERRVPQGMMVSTTHGRPEVRPFQVGFPAVLTSGFNPTTGYSWQQQILDLALPGIDSPGVPRTGDRAFTPDNNQHLQAGQKGWLEIDAQAQGWVFIPTPSSGTCPGDGNDPWVALFPPANINGELWVTGAQLGVYIDADGVSRLCPYNQQSVLLGCLTACGSGSGSGGCNWWGCNPDDDASPPSTLYLNVSLDGAACYSNIALTLGYIDIGGTPVQGFQGVYTDPTTDRQWYFTLPLCYATPELLIVSGEVSYGLDLTVCSCSPVCLSAECTSSACIAGVNSVGLYTCAQGAVFTVSPTPSTLTCPDCGGSGSGSGSGGSGSGSGSGGGCPTSGSVVVTLSGLTGECSGYDGSYTLDWNGSEFAFAGGGSFAIAFSGCAAIGNAAEGLVSVTGISGSGGTASVDVEGTLSPLDLTGSGTVSGGLCAGQTITATVTT